MQITDILLVARGGVHYQSAVSRLISLVQSLLGTTYGAADIAARDALTGLSQFDTVHVADAGGGEWARYQPTTLDGNGSGTAWLEISNQSALASAGTATNLTTTPSATAVSVNSSTGTDASIPLADATNAGLMAPAEKAKLGNVTVTQPVDLDAIETSVAANVTAVAANATAIALNTAARHDAATLGGSATTNPLTLTGQEIGFSIAGLANLPA